MPASMISADTGCSAYVVGSSIAIVATGPMPGSTPISVPSMQPMNAYMRLTGVKATPKPVARWLRSSMSVPEERGPDRQLHAKSDHEDADRKRRQQQPGDDRFLVAELVARGRRRDDE